MTTAAVAGWPRHALLAGGLGGRAYVLVLPVAVLSPGGGLRRTSTWSCVGPLRSLSEFGLTSIGWYMPTEPMLLRCCCLWRGSGQTPTALSPILSYVIPRGFCGWA